MNSNDDVCAEIVIERKSKLDPSYIVLVLALLLAMAFLVWYARLDTVLASDNTQLRQQVDEFSTVKVGDYLPAIPVRTLDGNAVPLYQQHGSEVLLFLSLHCKACMSEVPRLADISNVLASRGYRLRVVGLDSEEETRAFFRESP